jgi:predicted phosphoribosyltransferase
VSPRDPHPFFADRAAGGRALAEHLAPYLPAAGARLVTLTPGGEQVAAGLREALRHPGDGAVVLVDDGLAGPREVLAEVSRLRSDGERRIIYAVPVAVPATPAAAYEVVDAVVCVKVPEPLRDERDWYAS